MAAVPASRGHARGPLKLAVAAGAPREWGARRRREIWQGRPGRERYYAAAGFRGDSYGSKNDVLTEAAG